MHLLDLQAHMKLFKKIYAQKYLWTDRQMKGKSQLEWLHNKASHYYWAKSL